MTATGLAKTAGLIAIVVMIIGTSCVLRSCVMPQATRQGKVGLEFAQALVAKDYRRAQELLAPALAAQYTVTKLAAEYEQMVSYGSGPAKHVQVVQAMDFWPAKQPSDVGWAYVAIAGDSFSEAVAVTVAEENGRLVIRELEWGRP